MISCKELADLIDWSAVRAQNELDIPTEKLMLGLSELAKSYIGEYQAGWAPLAETTLNGWMGFPGKIELGYSPPDNPLLREGAMRESIGGEAAIMPGGAEGVVGSRDIVALWQEMGTTRGIPPRPFLGLAMMQSQAAATVLFGEFALTLLAPR